MSLIGLSCRRKIEPSLEKRTASDSDDYRWFPGLRCRPLYKIASNFFSFTFFSLESFFTFVTDAASNILPQQQQEQLRQQPLTPPPLASVSSFPSDKNFGTNPAIKLEAYTDSPPFSQLSLGVTSVFAYPCHCCCRCCCCSYNRHYIIWTPWITWGIFTQLNLDFLFISFKLNVRNFFPSLPSSEARIET